jgi:hypothetical protein
MFPKDHDTGELIHCEGRSDMPSIQQPGPVKIRPAVGALNRLATPTDFELWNDLVWRGG